MRRSVSVVFRAEGLTIGGSGFQSAWYLVKGVSVLVRPGLWGV